MEDIKILLLGAGGHAKVLLDCLLTQQNISIIGFLDVKTENIGKKILGFPILGNENEILKNYSTDEIKLINGIGSTGFTTNRENIFNRFKIVGYQFFNVIHSTAYVSQHVTLGEGIQLMAGATIQPGTNLGNNVIVNTRAIIEHDCQIGSHVHIASGAICGGNVVVGDNVHIGSGAVIRQGINIGPNSLIAAGAVVVKDINAGSKVAGVPAKNME